MAQAQMASRLDALTIFQGFPLRLLKDVLSDWAQQLGKSAEEKINNELKNVKKGDSLGVLTVLDHDLAKRVVTLQLRGTYPLLGQAAFVRSRFQFEDEISLSNGPVVKGFKLLSFMAEIKVKKEGLYECALGYGFDVAPPYSVGRGMIDLVGPGIRLDVFLGGLSDTGFAVALSVGGSGSEKANKFPVVIPLGATGLGLTGIGGSFAHNFEPILLDAGGKATNNPTAHDYVTWARRTDGDELDVWKPASPDGAYRGGLGINCDIVTLDGFLLRFRKVGFAYLSYGPVIIFGGSGILLQSDVCRIDALAALDFASGSIAMAAGATIKIPPDGSWRIIEAGGGMEVFLSARSPGLSYYNLGTEKAPIHGAFLIDVAQAAVYFMLNTQRVKAGGQLRFAFHIVLGPFKVEVFYALVGSAQLGWNPVQIGASLGLSGGLKACAFGVCLGLELGGSIDIAVPRPVRFALTVSLSLDLPWPLPSVSWTGKVIDYSNADPPALVAPLLLGAGAGKQAAALGAVHARTGRQWKLDDPVTARIWPDSDLVIPFSRKVTDGSGIVMGPKVASAIEGGFSVSHQLKELQVIHLTKQLDGTVKETPKAGLQALWVAGPDGDVSRLHVPCEDPFAWLVPYRTTEEVAHVSPPLVTEQMFGGGPPEYGISSGRAFGSIVITPKVTVDLIYLATDLKHTRFLAGADFEIRLLDPVASSPLLVDRLVLTVATSDKDAWSYLELEPGFVAGPLEKRVELGGELFLCTVEIRRVNAKAFSTVRLSTTIKDPCPMEGPDGKHPICFRRLLIHSVRFVQVASSEVDWRERVVLTPGMYRLNIVGQSVASGYGVPSPMVGWKYSSKEFRVVYPEQLRPYIHYTTLGDSRIFGTTQKSWDPTPFGRGFPKYLGDVGTVRFNASYLSKIFSSLTAEIVNSRHSSTKIAQLVPTANSEKSTSLSKNSLKWRADYQAKVLYDEEISIDTQWTPGVGHLRISYADGTQSPPTDVLLDEWNFDISRFNDVSAHLQLAAPSVLTVYTTEGPVQLSPSSWPSGAIPTLQPVKPEAAPIDWPLPKALGNLVSQDLESDAVSSASLRFLQFAQRLGTRFESGNQDAIVGLIEPSTTTVMEAAVDRARRPYALLLRTPEPLDWRRINVEAIIYPIELGPSGQYRFSNTSPIALAVRIVPNVDATQTFLIAYVGDVAVRWPRGAYELRLTYKRKREGLPTIVSKSEGSLDKTIAQRLLYPAGRDWPI